MQHSVLLTIPTRSFLEMKLVTSKACCNTDNIMISESMSPEIHQGQESQSVVQ